MTDSDIDLDLDDDFLDDADAPDEEPIAGLGDDNEEPDTNMVCEPDGLVDPA